MLQEPNAHIYGYLNYYLDLPYPPQFVVMIDGPWGVGKTYLIKRFLRQRFAEDIKKYIYVSLFGLSSREELDEALLAATFVSKGTMPSISVARLTWKLLTRNKAWKDLDNLQAEVIVFDDFERCELDVNSVLGYINDLVERDGRKVIIVGNQAEMEKLSRNQKGEGTTWNSFILRKEKVIGKTLVVQNNTEEVAKSFIYSITSSDVRLFLHKNISEIGNMLRKLDISNLRVLQQTIWDFENIFKQIKPAHRNNFDAMNNILRTFFPLSLEYKLGTLKPDQIKQFRSAYMKEEVASENEATVAAILSKYSTIPTIDAVLTEEVIYQIIVRGFVDAEALAKCLDTSVYFIDEQQEPAWRTIWNYRQRAEQAFNNAVAKMNEEFARREFKQIPLIIQVFSLRLLLCDMSLIPSREQAVQECKQYIDDIAMEEWFTPISYSSNGERPGAADAFKFARRSNNTENLESCDGLRFAKDFSDTDFKKIFTYMMTKRQQKLRMLLPAMAEWLLAEMTSDPRSFCSRINSESPYRAPVFAHIEPRKFAERFLLLEPSAQFSVMQSLRERYRTGLLESDLAEEKDWLFRVRDEFLSAAGQMQAMPSYRLKQNLQWITSVLRREAV